jgi:hypothetical protein
VQDSIAGVDAEWLNKVINSQLPYRQERMFSAAGQAGQNLVLTTETIAA